MCATAIRLVHAAEAAGASSRAIGDHVLGAADTEGVTGWDRRALESLVLPGMAIRLVEDDGELSYDEGRHRVAAMLDAGVRHTVLARLELLDPVTREPLPDLE